MALPTICKASSYNGPTVYETGGGGDGIEEIAGHTYRTTTINGVTWLAENLRLIFDGAIINPATYNSQPSIFYNLLSIYTYGFLYNWWAAKYIQDNRYYLIPGWRVAELDDYNDLINSIGGLANVPNILYEKNWTGSSSDNLKFSMKPSGAWTGSGVSSQGIDFSSGRAEFECITMYDSNKEFHLDCTSSSASFTYNARGAGRSIRLIKE